MSVDLINRPPHYTGHASGIEPISVARHMTFDLGNAVKYLMRRTKKHDSPLEDLRKAAWYLRDEIATRHTTPAPYVRDSVQKDVIAKLREVAKHETPNISEAMHGIARAHMVMRSSVIHLTIAVVAVDREIEEVKAKGGS